MSNAIRFKADETGFRPDAATARRQFWLSLGVGLAALAAAATIAAQPTRAAPDAPNARQGQVGAPEFVASPVAAAQLRRTMTAGARESAN
jgi:hypothetical protein